MIYIYIQAVDYIKENAIFELDMLNQLYKADDTGHLGVTIDTHTKDSIKIIIDKYPNYRTNLECISQPTTPSLEKQSNS